jgi:glycerol uptake facilitator-like aquaporin
MFAGFAPSSVMPLVLAQVVGAALVCATVLMLWAPADDLGQGAVVPRESTDLGS